jgi:2-keto-4-pentenoate hydratase/2-oxohepta-3-ene-1,7-dioic acid hydratase in catechol pathway
MKIATLRNSGGELALAFATSGDRLVLVRDILAKGGLGRAAPIDAAVASWLLAPAAPDWVRPEGLKALATIDALAQRVECPAADLAVWQFAPPIVRPGKIIAVGRNYMDHVREGQEIWAKRGRTVTIPEFPSAFAKYPSSLIGHLTPIALPDGHQDVDYEIELAVVIGRNALNVSEVQALDHVAGYTVCNDIGARGIQRKEMEAQIGISLAKNFPGFAPMGPFLVTADEIPDPQSLEIRLDVDGEARQHANTSDMIFPVARLISYWSQTGLEVGDILITGTPSGIALGRPEPEKFYLRAGQTVTASIEKVGALVNTMIGSA